MDYSNWMANLQSRGYKTTNVNGETNFAGYANALSDDIKARVAQNANSKELQALVASLFGGKSVMQSSQFVSTLKAKGLKVNVNYVKTSYIVDEKQSGTKGQGKVKNGSIAIYEITDDKGGKLTIADANGNAAIEMEEVFLNEVLSGVTSDIANGGAQNDSKIEALKAKDTQLKAEIDKLQKQYEKEIEQAEEKIKEEQEKIEKETQEIAKRWEKKIETDPSKIHDMENELSSVLNKGHARIKTYQNQINYSNTSAKLQNVINNAIRVDAQLNKENTSMKGYEAQQMPSTSNKVQQYNQMLKENAKSAQYVTQDVTKTTKSNTQNVNSMQEELLDKSKQAYEKALEEQKQVA